MDPLRWARRYAMDPLLAKRHPRRFHDRIEVVQMGPVRVRRPFVRACILYLLGLVIVVAGLLSGVVAVTIAGMALAVASLLIVWAKWRFDPRRSPIVPLVPFILVSSLIGGQRRARRLTAAPPAAKP
jgi:hypothetical protein